MKQKYLNLKAKNTKKDLKKLLCKESKLVAKSSKKILKELEKMEN